MFVLKSNINFYFTLKIEDALTKNRCKLFSGNIQYLNHQDYISGSVGSLNTVQAGSGSKKYGTLFLKTTERNGPGGDQELWQ